MVLSAAPNKPRLAIIAQIVATLGHSLEKPSVYLRPTAHPIYGRLFQTMAERSDDLRDDSQLWFVGGSTQNHPRRHGLRSVDRDWCSRHGHYRDSVPGRIERGATHSLHRSHRGWRHRPQVRLRLRTLIMTIRMGLTLKVA